MANIIAYPKPPTKLAPVTMHCMKCRAKVRAEDESEAVRKLTKHLVSVHYPQARKES